MAKDIGSAVREVCLSFPDAEEVPSRGSPDFRVRGKTFATYTINHHGDGRVALWLPALPGAQQLHTEVEPRHYFVPPYVGPRGWLGVNLDTGLDWLSIAERVREAYVTVASVELARLIGPTIQIEPPDETIDPAEFDPMVRPRAQRVMAATREICLALPETSQGTQFGHPVFKAGKKSFCTAYHRSERIKLSFWVGGEMQAMLTFEDRYRIPAYTGHHGWIELDVEDEFNRQEVTELVRVSYKHFALKRMIKALAESSQAV